MSEAPGFRAAVRVYYGMWEGRGEGGSAGGALGDQAMRGFLELLGELWHYLAHNKRWWLTPILVVMVLLSLLLILTSSPLSPMFYAIF